MFRVKKIGIFLSVFFASVIGMQLQAYGLHMQQEQLENKLTGYFKEHQADKELSSLELQNLLQQESVNLDFDLRFDCSQESFSDSKQYNICGYDTLTNAKVCDATVGRNNDGSGYVTVGINTDIDGCICTAEEGLLKVSKPIETVFIKSGKNTYIADESDFISGDKNVYKIIQKPSLTQVISGPCGYYALNNILKAYKGQDSPAQLLSRTEFDLFHDEIRAFNDHNIAVSNYAMKDIIEKKVTELCKKNVIIAFGDMGRQLTIGNFEAMYFGGGSACDRIKDFQENGTPMYLIASTSSKGKIPGLKLNWDNISDRLYSTENHWIALKIAWEDESKPGKCPVVLTVFDSSGPKDNRFSAIVHWYYNVFTHGFA